MTIWLVVYLYYNCGGWLASRVIPTGPSRALVCAAEPRHEAFVLKEDAIDRVKKLGSIAKPQLSVCDGDGCREYHVEWTETLVIK